MVNTKEGDSVTLECNYTINNETIGWYKWYRHQLHGDEVSNNTGYYKGRVSMASPSDFTEKASASITLHNVSITDTGMYICEVNINEMISGHGNGTFFKVSEREYENAESGIGKVRNVVRGLGYYIFLSIGLVTVITGVIIYMCHSKTGECVFFVSLRLANIILQLAEKKDHHTQSYVFLRCHLRQKATHVSTHPYPPCAALVSPISVPSLL
uniref:Natural cytotoxicity triggering receptor 3 n=1 Tax=Leptobrachium leishanense TaxID=445787 RepID=A0A8C5PXQ9_9ANUR